MKKASLILFVAMLATASLAQTPRVSWNPATKTIESGSNSYRMVFVKGGTFTMGATKEQQELAQKKEYPPHEVTLSSYYIGQYEVPEWLWTAVMGNDDYGYEHVSWYDCQTFVKRLNMWFAGEDDNGRYWWFSLPTEAEWEFAARGGNNSNGYRYSGSSDNTKVAMCAGLDDIYEGTPQTALPDAPVPNELGLYEMSGYNEEWCLDWYGPYPSQPQTNPTGPAKGTRKVLRGGYWIDEACNCRVSYRGKLEPQNESWTSFRIVLCASSDPYSRPAKTE